MIIQLGRVLSAEWSRIEIPGVVASLSPFKFWNWPSSFGAGLETSDGRSKVDPVTSARLDTSIPSWSRKMPTPMFCQWVKAVNNFFDTSVSALSISWFWLIRTFFYPSTEWHIPILWNPFHYTTTRACEVREKIIENLTFQWSEKTHKK